MLQKTKNSMEKQKLPRKFFIKDEMVRAKNNKPLPGNESGVAPPLEINKNYKVKRIHLDSKGNQHLDVGLISKHNFIRSYETDEELPDGDKIHWCHPSRFDPVN
jgi:hypothetical protein